MVQPLLGCNKPLTVSQSSYTVGLDSFWLFSFVCLFWSSSGGLRSWSFTACHFADLYPHLFCSLLLLFLLGPLASFIFFYIFFMFIFLCCSGGDILRSVFQFSISRLIVIFSYHIKMNTSFYYLYWLLLNGMFDYCPLWDNIHIDFIFYFMSEYYKYTY